MNFLEISKLDHIRNIFLYPRSLTGHGTRRTLYYFEKYFTCLERLEFNSGEKVFDWEIPLEWNIKDGYIKHVDSGKKFACFSDNPLHIVGYSIPVDIKISLKELNSHIHTCPANDDWIPYVTSYYKDYWGFCMPKRLKDKLKAGVYEVKIDSNKAKGTLEMSHAVLQGELPDEVFFSSYICHPSMANNELSGPIVLMSLLQYVRDRYPQPRMTYRFLLAPETIGAIAYLSRYLNYLKDHMKMGFVLSCVGDEREYSYIESPYANTLADTALKSSLVGYKNVKSYTFLDRGSDERQYCSPNVRLPVTTFCRSKFGTYPEYHSSADLPDSVVTDKGLDDSFLVMKNIIDAIELGLYPRCTTLCEPQLGKRNLYPTISNSSYQQKHLARDRMNLVAYCDGTNTIFDISLKTDIPLEKVVSEFSILLSNHIIEFVDKKNDE